MNVDRVLAGVAGGLATGVVLVGAAFLVPAGSGGGQVVRAGSYSASPSPIFSDGAVGSGANDVNAPVVVGGVETERVSSAPQLAAAPSESVVPDVVVSSDVQEAVESEVASASDSTATIAKPYRQLACEKWSDGSPGSSPAGWYAGSFPSPVVDAYPTWFRGCVEAVIGQ